MVTVAQCEYCMMTGFKDWQAYNEHLQDERALRKDRKRMDPELKARIVDKVESRLAQWILTPKAVCMYCGPTDNETYSRPDGQAICESCLQRATKGELTIC
jgi:hypothetical protein